MGLLKNRPLCVFCMLFIAASWLSLYAEYAFKTYALIALAVIVVLLLGLTILLKK